MKQTLHLRGELCPKTKLYTKILYTIYITFTIVLVSCVCTRAQVSASSQEAGPAAEAVSKIKPLEIGDTIPDALWNMPLQAVNHPQGKGTITLNDYRGKPVILDFWATWCSACIANFPKLEDLQVQFKELRVLSLTHEGTERTDRFFSTKKDLKNQPYTFLSAVNAIKLGSFFSHRLLPHYVWIDRSGKVIAFTSSDSLNETEVGTFVRSGTVDTPNKHDIDPSRPLFSGDYLPQQNMLSYEVFFKGKLLGLGAGNRSRKTDQVIGRAWTNIPLLNMYFMCIKNVVHNITYKRLIVEVKDPSKIKKEASTLSKADWYKQNSYTYEKIIPLRDSADLYPLMLEGLNQYSDFHAGMERREIKYWALCKVDARKFGTKGGRYKYTLRDDGNGVLKNAPIFHLISWAEDLEIINALIIDETGYKGHVDLTFDLESVDISSFKKALHDQGLDLKEKTGPVDMLVIRDKY